MMARFLAWEKAIFKLSLWVGAIFLVVSPLGYAAYLFVLAKDGEERGFLAFLSLAPSATVGLILLGTGINVIVTMVGIAINHMKSLT